MTIQLFEKQKTKDLNASKIIQIDSTWFILKIVVWRCDSKEKLIDNFIF
jgi:hypothetical protein